MAGDHDFRTTIWSEISRAKHKSTAALNQTFERYREPIRQYVKTQGVPESDADDLTQEVLRRIVEKDLLLKADKNKGRFRCLIIGITRHVIQEDRKRRNALRRGGGKNGAPLDDGGEGLQLEDCLGEQVEDEQFDRLWMMNLIRQAMDAVRNEAKSRGEKYVEMLRIKALEGPSHEELAKRFGLTVQDVKNYLHRARTRIGAHIRTYVKDYSSSPGEFETEIRYLSKYLPGGASGESSAAGPD